MYISGEVSVGLSDTVVRDFSENRLIEEMEIKIGWKC